MAIFYFCDLANICSGDESLLDALSLRVIVRMPNTGIVTPMRRGFCLYSIFGIAAFGLLEENTKNHGISSA